MIYGAPPTEQPLTAAGLPENMPRLKGARLIVSSVGEQLFGAADRQFYGNICGCLEHLSRIPQWRYRTSALCANL